MSDDNTLLGVVTPFRDDEEIVEAQVLDAQLRETLQGDPDQPPPLEQTPFEDAQARVVIALAMTQERLSELRIKRDEIAAEIRLLVDEEELLQRMARVRRGVRGPRRDDAPDPSTG